MTVSPSHQKLVRGVHKPNPDVHIMHCSENRSAFPCRELLICCSTGFRRICSVHVQPVGPGPIRIRPWQFTTNENGGLFRIFLLSLPFESFHIDISAARRLRKMDSDHRFYAFEITASQFQLFIRRTALRQYSSSALNLRNKNYLSNQSISISRDSIQQA